MSQEVDQLSQPMNLTKNCSLNMDCDEPPWPYTYRILIPLGVFCFAGILGNVLFCIVVFVDRSLRRQKSNTLLTLMAFGDIIVLVTSYLSSVYLESPVIGQWPWSEDLCRFKHAFPDFAQALCIFSLTACSIERYLGVVKFPMGKTSRMWTVISVVVILILSLTTAGFSWWWAELFYVICVKHPIDNDNWRWFLLGRFMCIYLIPLCIVFYCYLSIGRRIYKSRSLVKEDRGFQLGVRNALAKRKKGIIVLLGITLSFALLWLPYHVYLLDLAFHHEMRSNIVFDIMKELYHYSAIANSVLDPVLIFMLSSEHRKALRTLLTCNHSCSKYDGSGGKHLPPSTSRNTMSSGSSVKKNNLINVTTTTC